MRVPEQAQGVSGAGSPELTMPTVVYLRASEFSDVEFLAREQLEQYQPGAKLSGWIVETSASETSGGIKFRIHSYPASFVVKRVNERYAVIRLEDAAQQPDETVEFEFPGLIGYKSTNPSDSKFYRVYGTSPNFDVRCNYKDRGLIIAKVDYNAHPAFELLNGYSLNRPLAAIKLQRPDVDEKLVDEYVAEITTKLNLREIQLLIQKLTQQLRE